MSAPTLKPSGLSSRLGRFVTLKRLATVFTWVFWLSVILDALQLLSPADPQTRGHTRA